MSPISVFIVEPDHENRVSLRRIFEDAGHFVVSASSGAEALMALEKMSVPPIMFLSSDAVMMSGESFLTSFRAHEQFAKVPVAQIKKDGDPALLGICASISLPFTAAAVLECLKHCF